MNGEPSYDELKRKVRILEDDVTKINRASALRESEQRYHRLVETMGGGLSEIDASGVATYTNRRLCELLGYSRNEIPGRLRHGCTVYGDTDHLRFFR